MRGIMPVDRQEKVRECRIYMKDELLHVEGFDAPVSFYLDIDNPASLMFSDGTVVFIEYDYSEISYMTVAKEGGCEYFISDDKAELTISGCNLHWVGVGDCFVQ